MTMVYCPRPGTFRQFIPGRKIVFSIFEALMLVCFGIGWPVSILKALRTQEVKGKSPLFMGIIWLGYLSGIIHKLTQSPDPVIALYIFNLIMISIDLLLYVRYRPRPALSAR